MSLNRSVWILGDQLMRDHPALQYRDAQIVMIESRVRRAKLPYHPYKIVLLFSAMRHHAAWLREQGYIVDYIQADTFVAGLQQHVDNYQPDELIIMAASDYPGRRWQTDMLHTVVDVPVTVLDNAQFLVEIHEPYPDKNPSMEYFYREMRRHFDVLMDGDKPSGGEWNYDKLNRERLPDDVSLPDDAVFKADEITRTVMGEVEYSDGFAYAVTHSQAEAALEYFISERLQQFGPYEDAMTTRSDTLFHAVLSPYLNIGLLRPLDVIRRVERAYREGEAPIQSVEGFIRQVLGWREYMYRQYWRYMPDLAQENYWRAERGVPAFFWDGETEMACMRSALGQLERTAYNHHIERLMLVSNFFTLAGINPQQATAWFKARYIDAYDWVMQANVIGMGLNADGGKIATKPYIASANYINKMSDYCLGCRFKHTVRTGEDACPFNYLYWNFLIEHEDTLRSNPRMGRNVLGLRHLDDAERGRVRESAQRFLGRL